MAEFSKRIGYVCGNCGSSNVVSDARAQWNAEKQKWIVVGHYDSSECLDCEQEETMIEVELTPEPQA